MSIDKEKTAHECTEGNVAFGNGTITYFLLQGWASYQEVPWRCESS